MLLGELFSTADKAIQDMGLLEVAALLTQVKAVAVQPVAVGILRAVAHSAKQASGERFQTFAAKVRGLTTDCNYILALPPRSSSSSSSSSSSRGASVQHRELRRH